MKSSVAAISLLAAVAAADTSLSQILSGMKVCGWACLPSAAADNECAITNLDCLCQTGEGGILAGTRVSSLTGCEKAIKFCGVEGDKHFDLGDALDSACERFRSGKPSADELQSMTDYINAHYASATAIVGSATGASSAAATGTGNPAKTTAAGGSAAATTASAAASGSSGTAGSSGGSSAAAGSGQSSTHKGAAATAAPMMALAGAGAVVAAALF